MTTQPSESNEEVLQDEADVARQRLMAAIDRLDTRARTWVERATETTRVSTWGLVGAAAFWAGVVVVTRRRQRSQQTALVLRARSKPSVVRSAVIQGARAAAALLGFFASRAFAMRLIAMHHEQRAALPSDMPHVGRVSVVDAALLPMGPVAAFETHGTPNA